MRVVVLALSSLLVYALPASAHALGAECKLRGGRVEVEGYYDDNTPARDARVTVRDAAGQTVADGRTDDKGRWSFPAPEPGRYHVIVDAGAGHRAVVSVTVPEAASAPPTFTSTPDAGPGPPAETVISEGPGRAEFTRVPWTKIAIGFAVIAGLAAAARLFLRRPAG
jgi:nickel transport protein